MAKQLKPALDNLAIAPDGTIYVSNMADNSVQAFNPATGAVRTLTRGKLAVPAGMKIDGDQLWVADMFAFRQVDARTGEVQRRSSACTPSELEYPFAVGVSPQHIALSSWFTGTVQLVDRATLKTGAMIHGLKAPSTRSRWPTAACSYAEIATGSITRASGDRA